MPLKSSMLKHHQILLLILLFILSFVVVELHEEESTTNQHHHHKSAAFNSFRLFSSFESLNNTKVTAQVGGTATLPCVVDESSPATVTWIRRSDYILLTVGLATYSSDERFHVQHVRHRGIWNLKIKSVTKDDEGIYECNLSLHPPESIFIEVTVVEAIAEIIGLPDVHIHEGSTLKLECKIIQATENPSFVFWYHEDRMVNFNHQDGFSVMAISRAPHHEQFSSVFKSNISNKLVTNQQSLDLVNRDNYKEDEDENENDDYVIRDDEEILDEMEMETNPMLTDSRNIIESDSFHETPTASSILVVNEVQYKHGGNYTCAPSNTRPTYINVHVLKGEKPAAMKHSNQSETAEMVASSTSTSTFNVWMMYILSCLIIYASGVKES